MQRRANISSGPMHLQEALTSRHGLQSPCAQALKRRVPSHWNTFLIKRRKFRHAVQRTQEREGGNFSAPPSPGTARSGAFGPTLVGPGNVDEGNSTWRLRMVGAPDARAGKQWGQAPPDIKEYATPAQCNAWRLRMGLETAYTQGSTPTRFCQASPLLRDHSFGCVDLFEDAMLS